jgi:hypothetical protein
MAVLRPIIIGERGEPFYEVAAGTTIGYEFHCPGCDSLHWFKTAGKGIAWSFDGNLEKPTFTPSLLMWGGGTAEDPRPAFRCHTFVRNGQVEYLGDCTHSYAGKTIPLPELED